MKKRHDKEKKEIKFEEDLRYFIKLKDKYNSIFENYDNLYDNFVSKNEFDAEEKKTGKIKCKSTNKFLLYAKDNYSELSMVLDALIKFGFLKPQDISTSIQIYLINMNLNGIKINKFNSRYDVINALKKAISESNTFLMIALEWAIKSYVFSRGEKLKRRIQFINEAYPNFKQYYELIVNQEIIPDELVNIISKLMMNQEFTIPSETIDEKDPILALLIYTKEFSNYTCFHNLTVQKNKELQAIKDFEKATKKLNETSLPNEGSTSSEEKNEIIEEDSAYEVNNMVNQEEIDNMVKSFLPGICADDRCSVEADMLPSKYDPNYNDIIIGLLKAYEEYTSGLEKSTMRDFNKYNDLLIMVEQIEAKS